MARLLLYHLIDYRRIFSLIDIVEPFLPIGFQITLPVVSVVRAIPVSYTHLGRGGTLPLEDEALPQPRELLHEQEHLGETAHRFPCLRRAVLRQILRQGEQMCIRDRLCIARTTLTT